MVDLSIRVVIQQVWSVLSVFLSSSLPANSPDKTAVFLAKCSTPIAHRGGKPENTLEAIRQSKEDGAVAVEVDLSFTKDHHPVILHDSTVDRTSNGSGFINSLTLEEVRKMDFGIKSGQAYKGAKIPTLHETVALVKELDMLLFLELKDDKDEAVAAVLDMFAEDKTLYETVAVISFFPDFLLPIRKEDPNIITGLNLRATHFTYFVSGTPRYSSWWKHYAFKLLDRFVFWFETEKVWTYLGVGMILPHKEDILSGRFDIEKFRSKGVGVVTWTVNSAKDKDHFSDVLKVPFITDQIVGIAPDQTV